METKRLNFLAEIKATEEQGIIEGYGSVWNVLDSYSDVVAKGAFKNSLKEAKSDGRMPAMLWQHDMTQPIGVWTDMREDDTGLYVKGQLADTQLGREAYNLIKMGALTGLSIGYSTVKYKVDNETGVRTLTDVKLWEVSPVTFPANGEARISGVKSADDIRTERDFEGFLREAGFSKTEAKTIVAHGFKALKRRDAEETPKELLDELNRLATIFSTSR